MPPWLALALLVTPPARAHPIGSTYATQLVKVRVEDDAVDLTYTAEIPDDVLRGTSTGLDPRAAMAVELTAGLVLQVDDRVVPLARTEDAPAPRAGSRHTTVFEEHLRAPLPRGSARIRVSTTNLLELRNLYAGEVQVAPTWTVASCSLLAERDGRVVRDDSLRWIGEEEARSVEVVLAGHTPRAVATLLGRGTEPVRAGKRRAPGGWRAWAPPSMDTAGLVAVLGGAGVLGLGTRRPERPATLLGLGLGLVGVAAPLLDRPGTVELALGSLSLGAALVGAGPAAVGLGLAGLAATTGAWQAALLTVAVAVAGVAGGRGTSRTERIGAGLVALAVLGRGLAWLSA